MESKNSIVFSLILCWIYIDLKMGEVDGCEPVVSTEYGDIEGFNYENTKSFKSEIFLGIPYAKPPIGDLRYEKPLPPSPWTSTLQAKKYGPQSSTFTKMPNSSEDSLTLNIMKPKSPSDDPSGYPVMFFIHGGAFIGGSSASHSYTEIVDRLVSRGVIVVTINYQLGPFGFFTTGDSNAPGNYGLWDQVEALKFTQKVIHSFNGNAKNVTIFGASAGGASVSWLTLCPEAKDLFSRAITMGGSAYAPWAHAEDAVENSSSLLAKAAGCSDAKNVKECMKAKSAEEIIQAASSFIKTGVQCDNVNFGYFYPKLDGEFAVGKTMAEAIKNAPKKTNFLGICSQEYISFTLMNPYFDPDAKILPFSHEKAAAFTRENFIEILNALVANEKAYGTNAKEASNKILEFYETQKSLYHNNIYLQLLAQLFSDITFNIPAMREALQKAASGHDIYFFLYDFSPEIIKKFNKMELFEGAGHGYDFANIFGVQPGGPPIDFSDPKIAKVQKIYADLFVSFAKTGVPSSEGITVAKVASDSKLPFIEINVETKLKENLWPDRVKFWDKMAADFGFDWPEVRKVTALHEELKQKI